MGAPWSLFLCLKKEREKSTVFEVELKIQAN